MHYYSFNIADYKKDTDYLKPIEHYIYRSLIDRYYLDEMPIPIETQPLLRRLKLESESEVEALNFVLNEFFTLKEDGYHHERIDDDIQKYRENIKKNRENGKKGGRPPKNKPKETQSVSSGLPNESQKKPNYKPLTNNHEPLTNNQFPFDDFWNAYDKKVDTAKCRAKWERLSDRDKQLAMAHIPAYVKSTPDKKFRKNPMTYLNGECWLDEIPKSGSSKPRKQAEDDAPVIDFAKRREHLKPKIVYVGGAK